MVRSAALWTFSYRKFCHSNLDVCLYVFRENMCCQPRQNRSWCWRTNLYNEWTHPAFKLSSSWTELSPKNTWERNFSPNCHWTFVPRIYITTYPALYPSDSLTSTTICIMSMLSNTLNSLGYAMGKLLFGSGHSPRLKSYPKWTSWWRGCFLDKLLPVTQLSFWNWTY